MAKRHPLFLELGGWRRLGILGRAIEFRRQGPQVVEALYQSLASETLNAQFHGILKSQNALW
jgi:hypothetical protein